MSQSEQTTVFGGTYSTNIEIQTSGRIIRPFLRTIMPWVGECKMRFNQDGISVTAVEPANVACVTVDMDADAFDSYDVDGEFTAGVDLSGMDSALRHARYGKSTDDDVTIRIERSDDRPCTEMYTETEREFGGNSVLFEEKEPLIDPDSIRTEPDIPDLDLETVDVNVDAFRNTISAVSETADRVHVGLHSGALRMRANGDMKESAATVEVSGGLDSPNVESLYSTDYIEEMVSALNNGLVDGDVTVHIGDEFPIQVEFDREGVYSGAMMLAPRIRHE